MSVVSQFTLDQYERMVEAGVFERPNRQRLEFIHGEIREMTPIGTEHAYVVDLLNGWGHQTLPADDVMIRIQSPIRLPQLESSPEPDFVLVRPRSYREVHPDSGDIFLIVEVADSSLEYDRVEKARLYSESQVKDYWVVNLVERCVEVFREPSQNGFASHDALRAGDEIRPLAFPDSVFRPSMVFDP